MDADEKRGAIAARRGTLEHELFGAELDLKVAKEHDEDVLAEEPQKRLDRIKRQMEVLDKEEGKL
jgi:hypothetical protein